MNTVFPEDSAARKTFPVYSGLLQYFPSALAAVANHSFNGNEKHNPGQALHHDRAKSSDEADALVRHLMEGDLVGMAWRALAMLQKHLEANGSPVAPAARNATPTPPKEHRRVATPAELAAYRDNGRRYPTDRKGVVFSTGDTVRIVDPSHDDVLCGFGKGSHAKVASRNHVNQMVLLQGGTDTRWFHGRQLEVIS